MSERHGHPFSAVDDQPAPGSWVAVLDRLRQEPFYRAYKARAVELLVPRPGRRYLEVGGCLADRPFQHLADPAAASARWPELFDEAVAAGRFLYAVTFFLTAGTRPGVRGSEGKR
jgi:hypothetical protein